MNIGILTFHKAHNYGAVLQAYGLQKTLEGLGHNVSFVDYAIPSMLLMYNWYGGVRSIINKHFFSTGLHLISTMFLKKKRYDSFIKFTKQYMKESKYGTSKLDEEYDVIIVGSDQVFNANITKGVNNAYWGVLPSFTKHIITYAASTRPYSPTAEQSRDIKNNLKRFSALSVREPYTADFLKQFTEMPVELVIDPTLLVGKRTWEGITAKPLMSKPYLFYYYLDETDCDLSFARYLAKEKNLQLVVIGCWNSLYSTNKTFGAGPSEFLSLVKNAEYILTSSFHCTVFSIVFNKQFSVLPIKGKEDYRVSNLLSMFKLDNRMVSGNSYQQDVIYDWTYVNKKLIDLPKKSIEFLKTNLS